MLVSRVNLVYVQALQNALYNWREQNRWADDIPYESFPREYRSAIEAAASEAVYRPSIVSRVP